VSEFCVHMYQSAYVKTKNMDTKSFLVPLRCATLGLLRGRPTITRLAALHAVLGVVPGPTHALHVTSAPYGAPMSTERRRDVHIPWLCTIAIPANFVLMPGTLGFVVLADAKHPRES